MIELDASPAAKFKHHASTPREPLVMAGAGKPPHEDGFNRLVEVGYYITPEAKFDTRDQAVDNFNRTFKTFCESLPPEAELFWRCEPEISCQGDFEYDHLFWKAYGRVHAFVSNKVDA